MKLKDLAQLVDELAKRRSPIAGMSIVDEPLMPEGLVLLIGPDGFAIYNTETGKLTVHDTGPLVPYYDFTMVSG